MSEGIHRLVMARVFTFSVTVVVFSITYHSTVYTWCLCSTNTTASNLRFDSFALLI